MVRKRGGRRRRPFVQKAPKKNLRAKANHPNSPPDATPNSAPRVRRRKRPGSMLGYYFGYDNMGINTKPSERTTRNTQVSEVN